MQFGRIVESSSSASFAVSALFGYEEVHGGVSSTFDESNVHPVVGICTYIWLLIKSESKLPIAVYT